MELEELKNNIDLLDYIRDQGNNIERVGTNTYRVNPCPACGHFDHFTVYTETNSYSSFNGCCNGGTIIDYLMEVEDMSKKEAISQLKEMADEEGHIVPSNKKDLSDNEVLNNKEGNRSIVEKARHNKCDYYYKRGLTDKTIEQYNLGYLPDGCDIGKDYKYVLPVSDNYIIFRSDSNNGNEKYRNRGSTEIFNSRYFLDFSLTDKKVFITEGIFDALSLEEMGLQAVSINSTKNINKLTELIRANKEVFKDKLIVIAFDNDEGGKETTEKLKKVLVEENLSCAALNLGKYNDVNEYFIENHVGLKQDIEFLQLQGTTYDYLINQFGADQEKQLYRPKIRTGFSGLDHMLGGSMYPGLYVLGGIASVGKTAFALQIADKIAENQQSVLFFSLEMSIYEMTCRSLTRAMFELQGNNDITTGHVINANYEGKEDIKKLLNEAINRYEVSSKHLTIIEGDFDLNIEKLKATVDDKISLTGNKPVIFLDYLQVLSPSDYKMTEKQQIDQAIVYLKRLSRDLDLPIVVISSLNRANYKNDASYEALKGSGDIEYTADVVMTLQLRKDKNDDINEVKNMDPRPIELWVLKNRRGKAYETLEMYYWAKQNYFAEDLR